MKNDCTTHCSWYGNSGDGPGYQNIDFQVGHVAADRAKKALARGLMKSEDSASDQTLCFRFGLLSQFQTGAVFYPCIGSLQA